MSDDAFEALDMGDEAYADRIAGMAAQAAQEAVAPLAEQIETAELRELVNQYPQLAQEEFSRPVIERAAQIAADHGFENPSAATIRHVLELTGVGEETQAQQQPSSDPWDILQILDDHVNRPRLPF